MNENEESPVDATPPNLSERNEEILADVEAIVRDNSQAAAEAAGEAEVAIEALEGAATEQAAEIAEAMKMEEQPVETSGVPAPMSAPPRQENDARKPTLTDRLTESTEFDAEATNDDRIMAALAYASQLLVPLLLPIVILISETSKKRAFQRYHAVQSIAVGVVVWSLEMALLVMAGVAAGTFILALCLCFLFPAMIALWLLPLYYAMLAYNGKRFRIRGLTQFLEDQRWL